jgi:hypothetical protein
VPAIPYLHHFIYIVFTEIAFDPTGRAIAASSSDFTAIVTRTFLITLLRCQTYILLEEELANISVARYAKFSSARSSIPLSPMAACLVRSASILSCQMSFAGRRSRRLGQLKEREESLGADGVYEQLSPEDQYLSCKCGRTLSYKILSLITGSLDYDVCCMYLSERSTLSKIGLS